MLVVAEAAGENEAADGIPLVGRAGHWLWSNLARAGIEREGFKCHNVLSCRPPANKLAKMGYEEEVILSCSPLLDATIAEMRAQCAGNGRTFVILTLGRIAFKRIMGIGEKDPILKEDYLCYPFWSARYGAWVIAADHPSYLMRGNNHLVPVIQFAFRRALEVAAGGFALHTPSYMRDPIPATFSQWVQDYLAAYQRDPSIVLSYDIETPHKKGKDEEKVAREDDEDYTILRCSFAYEPGRAVSVPWQAGYMAAVEQLFTHPGSKVGWNNSGYDDPRIRARMPMAGDLMDAMLMWHVLNSALPKGLGFVTPFYAQNVGMWKHLSEADPAGYNAQDADMALRCYYGIRQNLVENDQWGVFQRHVVELNRVLAYMSERGVMRDEGARGEAEAKLTGLLDGVEQRMADAVPTEARRLQVFKKTPKDTSGMVQVEGTRVARQCPLCATLVTSAAHFKPIGVKRRRKGEPENPCAGAKAAKVTVPATLWAKPLEFKVSKVSLQGYQKALRHQAIIDRRENKVTFDANAIESLVKKYPKDPLYPLIIEHRKLQKLLGTYIGVTQDNGTIHGGLSVGRDGRIHPQFTHNPSTLRLACQNPNAQNMPRSTKDPKNLGNLVRNLIIAAPGCVLVERDFSAIEAVLVGYFANDPSYIRLSKLSIHSYLASHVLERPADLTWPDADLADYFKEIKESKDPHVELVYNGSKRAIHLSGYGGTPKKMHLAEPETFKTVKEAERLQGIYFDLFPLVRKWQLACQLQAEKDGFLRNPFGYVHRFYRVFSYRKECGAWIREQGDDANKVLAFLPQSTAAGIIKEAMLRLYVDEVVWETLRLQVHDSLVCEPEKVRAEEVGERMRLEMEQPVPELRLPASYGMGECLNIQTAMKVGTRWGMMR